MCRLCGCYNFGSVGVNLNHHSRIPTIYFPCMVGNVPDDEKFKFCPYCGKKLTKESFIAKEFLPNE